MTLLYPQNLLPQFSRIFNLPSPPEPSPPSELTPDQLVHVIRPNAPALDRTRIDSDGQTSENGVYHLRGHAVLEQNDAILKADEIDYNEETGDAEARGHVFYQNFLQNEKITCDKVVYNVDDQKGKFYNVHGYVKNHIDARPGLLTSDNPFYFEAKWAERIEDKYILHDGIITGCKLPRPWWTLRGPIFDIVPKQRAIGHRSFFYIRNFPVFYFPFFYKSLEKQPRHSGFLTPNAGHSSIRGYMVGLGYFWAINRSYDATYKFQDFSQRGEAHHVDFRGKPNAKTDFDAIIYGVRDSGIVQNGVLNKYSGVEATVNLKSDLGDGWTGRVNINYLSSLAFREQFTDSFTEAIFSESTSTGFVTKHFDAYSIDIVALRTQLFQDATPGNYVILRKLPQVDFSSRDQEVDNPVLPLWFSMDSSAGLLHRTNPTELSNGAVQENSYATESFMPRLNLEPRVMTEWSFDGFTFAPYVSLHETYFGQSFVQGALAGPVLGPNVITNNGVDRFAEEMGFDLIFPSIERVYNKKTFLGDKLKHVVETRATYKFVTGVHNYNDLVRFDQTELLNDTNQILFGVTNRIYAKRGDTVNEILTWSLQQEKYFDPTFGNAIIPGQRNVIFDSLALTGYAYLAQPRAYSPIASELRISPINGIGFEWRSDYDPLHGSFIDNGIRVDVHYRKFFVAGGNNDVHGISVYNTSGAVQTVNQNFISPPENQFNAVAGYGNTNRRGWNGAASFVYDYRSSTLLNSTFQATYNTDCCGFSAQIYRFKFGIRDDTQYRVSFSIANVGAFGNLRKQERIF